MAPRQTREMIFVGQRGGRPLVAVFAFRTVNGSVTRSREVRGWLGHGREWETFLDERWSSGAHGSAWTIVPHGPLRVAAGGPGEIEALWFSRGGRSLRLELEEVLGEWSRGPASRLHLFSAALTVGGQTTSGPVMELLRLRRPAEDAAVTSEQFLLTSGDSLVLMLATGRSENGQSNGSPAIAWLRRRGEEQEWSEVHVIPRGGRPVLEARREIPRGWGILVPEAGLRGEVRPLAFSAEIGLVERTGRRGVMARYTVTGWIELDGRRVDVTGMARHVAE
jgi:hypothetical protein